MDIAQTANDRKDSSRKDVLEEKGECTGCGAAGEQDSGAPVQAETVTAAAGNYAACNTEGFGKLEKRHSDAGVSMPSRNVNCLQVDIVELLSAFNDIEEQHILLVEDDPIIHRHMCP